MHKPQQASFITVIAASLEADLDLLILFLRVSRHVFMVLIITYCRCQQPLPVLYDLCQNLLIDCMASSRILPA